MSGEPDRKEVKKILDIMMIPPIDNEQDADDELDSDSSDSESVEDVPLMKDINNSTLIDIFQKLYSHFDEDDIEISEQYSNRRKVVFELVNYDYVRKFV